MEIREITKIVTDVLAFLTVVGGVSVVVGLLSLIPQIKKFEVVSRVHSYIAHHATALSGFFALLAMLGSLYYSDIAGYNPCKFCWYQRIFMYPIVFLAITGLVKKESAMQYIVTLSAIGAPIALYHYLLQRGVVEATDCAVVGYSASCSSTFFMEYGYITIPMMALTVFAMILVIALIGKKN